MQTNLLWTGREYYSLENCLVERNDKGINVNSVIVGSYEKIIYRVDYNLKTNQSWATLFLEIFAQHNSLRQHFKFEGDGKGNWIVNGKRQEQFAHCIDVDIPLTPFTNTLPINRLNLADGQQRQISVIYFDLLKNQIIPVNQEYLRLTDKTYHYQNVPNDFEAEIEVDKDGFVVDYPELFVRTSALHTNYE